QLTDGDLRYFIAFYQSMAVSPSDDNRVMCAYNFPAIVKCVGPVGFQKLKLDRVLDSLVSDDCKEVRRRIAAGFHEVASILGRSSYSILLPFFQKLLGDSDVEIFLTLFKNVKHTLKAFASDDNSRRADQQENILFIILKRERQCAAVEPAHVPSQLPKSFKALMATHAHNAVNVSSSTTSSASSLNNIATNSTPSLARSPTSEGIGSHQKKDSSSSQPSPGGSQQTQGPLYPPNGPAVQSQAIQQQQQQANQQQQCSVKKIGGASGRGATIGWRTHFQVLSNFGYLHEFFESDLVVDHLVPLMFKLLNENVVMPIRKTAIDSICKYLRKARRQDQRDRICRQLAEFKDSYSYQYRLIFLDACTKILETSSRRFFKQNLFHDCLDLVAKDLVPNIRLRFIGMIPAIQKTLVLPHDAVLLAKLNQVIGIISVSDRHKDVTGFLFETVCKVNHRPPLQDEDAMGSARGSKSTSGSLLPQASAAANNGTPVAGSGVGTGAGSTSRRSSVSHGIQRPGGGGGSHGKHSHPSSRTNLAANAVENPTPTANANPNAKVMYIAESSCSMASTTGLPSSISDLEDKMKEEEEDRLISSEWESRQQQRDVLDDIRGDSVKRLNDTSSSMSSGSINNAPGGSKKGGSGLGSTAAGMHKYVKDNGSGSALATSSSGSLAGAHPIPAVKHKYHHAGGCMSASSSPSSSYTSLNSSSSVSSLTPKPRRVTITSTSGLGQSVVSSGGGGNGSGGGTGGTSTSPKGSGTSTSAALTPAISGGASTTNSTAAGSPSASSNSASSSPGGIVSANSGAVSRSLSTNGSSSSKQRGKSASPSPNNSSAPSPLLRSSGTASAPRNPKSRTVTTAITSGSGGSSSASSSNSNTTITGSGGAVAGGDKSTDSAHRNGGGINGNSNNTLTSTVSAPPPLNPKVAIGPRVTSLHSATSPRGSVSGSSTSASANRNGTPRRAPPGGGGGAVAGGNGGGFSGGGGGNGGGLSGTAAAGSAGGGYEGIGVGSMLVNGSALHGPVCTPGIIGNSVGAAAANIAAGGNGGASKGSGGKTSWTKTQLPPLSSRTVNGEKPR
ncbi:Serine/threonine-protein phosphatase 4 regulatory subunit 4, partial [Quaeritorhiza haematococci]